MVAKVFLKRKVSDFNFFFCFLTNTVFINKKYVWRRMTLPLNTFCALTTLSAGRSFTLKFLTESRTFWITFWNLVSFNRTLNTGFFLEVELMGLGFRIRKIISAVYRFFWGHANYTYLFVPEDVLVEYSSEEKFMFFFGINAASVYGLATYLMLLKRLSRYRVTGFVQPGKIIRLNSGKQR